MNSLDRDKALIESLGGPAKLAETLGYDKDGGVQRVQNWLSRGIPAAVKVDRPDLFLRDLATAQPSDPAPDRAQAASAHRKPRREGPSNNTHRNGG